MPTIAEILARELDKPLAHVQNVIDLLDQGNTIPFIARYRKELHGSMDDTALRTLEDRLQLSAEPGPAPPGGEKRHRRPGQADRGAVRRHRQRRHPGGGGGPVPPL